MSPQEFSSRLSTSLLMSICFLPEPPLPSSLGSARVSAVTMSGSACWEQASATEPGVGAWLSTLAAAWESCGETQGETLTVLVSAGRDAQDARGEPL